MTTTHPLTRTVPAVAANVGVLRRTVRGWLIEILDDPDVIDDLVLATSEALENAVDHAFVDAAAVGTMTLSATRDADTVTIVVCDTGRWQTPDPAQQYRGRGIDLIHRLADTSSVRPGAAGTAVTLVHHRVPAPR